MKTIKFKQYDEEYNLFLVVENYADNDNIAIALCGTDIGIFASLTVNVCSLPKGYACIDTNNFPEAIDLIKEYNLGEFTNHSVPSGYCTYPIYKLNMENILKYSKEVK